MVHPGMFGIALFASTTFVSVSPPALADAVPSIKQTTSSPREEISSTEAMTEMAIVIPVGGDRQGDAWVSQAEAIAQTTLEQQFAQSPPPNAIVLRLMDEYQGQIVPVLTVRVSRVDWQQQPRVNPWATYFGRSPQQLIHSPPSTLAPTPGASPLQPTRRGRGGRRRAAILEGIQI